MDNVQLQALFGRAPDWVESEDVSMGADSGRKLGAAGYRQAIAVVQTLDAVFAKIDNEHRTGELGPQGAARRKSRAVRDAATALDKVRNHEKKLTKELTEAQKAARPRVAPNDTVNASIWPKLPDDPHAVRTLYNDAIAASDWATANAIESLPTVFEGRLDSDTLTALRRDRQRVEAPEALAALEVAEETLTTVTGVLTTATGHVKEIGANLPAPNDGDDLTTGEDGLRELTPSQFLEATGARPQPGDLRL